MPTDVSFETWTLQLSRLLWKVQVMSGLEFCLCQGYWLVILFWLVCVISSYSSHLIMFEIRAIFHLIIRLRNRKVWAMRDWSYSRRNIRIVDMMLVLYFDLQPGPKMLFQGDAPEGSNTFQWPVIERDRVGGLRLIIWDKVKVLRCHYSDAPKESDLWTAWQLFPLDDD